MPAQLPFAIVTTTGRQALAIDRTSGPGDSVAAVGLGVGASAWTMTATIQGNPFTATQDTLNNGWQNIQSVRQDTGAIETTPTTTANTARTWEVDCQPFQQVALNITALTGGLPLVINSFFRQYGLGLLQSQGTSQAITGTLVVTSAASQAFAVGPSGGTNPTLQVNAATGSAVTGVSVVGAAVNSGVQILAISSTAGIGEQLTLQGGTAAAGGNAGGVAQVIGGTPGVTGAGGAAQLTGAAGGATSGTGGAATIVAGAGTAGNSAGGVSSLTGGAGQGSAAGGIGKTVGGAGGTTGAGGAAQLTGGAGGATSGTGGAATIAAGAGTGTTAVGGAASLTGGASAGASGTAGSASIDAGAATGGTKAAVNIADVNAAAVYLNRGGLAALQVGLTLTGLGTTQSSTPTSAQLLGGLITQTGATGAGTITLPTGTALSAACARVPVVGDTFDCVFINVGGGQTLTVTGATGTTVVGGATIATAVGTKLTFYNSGANTWNIYLS